MLHLVLGVKRYQQKAVGLTSAHAVLERRWTPFYSGTVMPMVRLSPGGWDGHVKNYYCCLRIMCFFIINGQKWLVSCGASSPGHRQTTDPNFISVTEVLMHTANLPGTRFILCTRNLLWNMNHTSFWDKPGEFSIVMENWLWECFIPAAVPDPDHCQRREMLRKEIDGSYIWRFASTPSVVAAVHSR